MTSVRPIWSHIRNICAILEASGPCGARAIGAHFPDIEPSNIGKYCSRAVGLGLVTVERGRRNHKNFSIFTVVEDWKDIADKRRTTKVITVAAPLARTRWHGVSSVFNMGMAA